MESSRESSDLVGLNVGGIIYKTSRTTLLRYPRSFFSGMLEGNFPSAKDENGNFIIDRDGQVFRHVLNFMRCGKMILPDDFKEYSLLECEADFFALDELQKEIKEIISFQVVLMMFNDGEMPCDGKLFCTTKKILSREDDSMFAKIIRGEVAVSKDSHGNFVRDGSLFPQIHSYLKKGAMLTDLDAQTLDSLRKDANYYSLEVLQQQIESISALHKNIADCKKFGVNNPYVSLHVYCWRDGPCVVYADKSGGGVMNDWDIGGICKEHVMICGGVFAGVLDPEKVKPGLPTTVDDVINLIMSKTSDDFVDFHVHRHLMNKNCTKVLFVEFDDSYPVNP